MAMGKRRQRQEALFITADGLTRSPGHPFYRKLNELLAEAEFDRWIERRCEQYYATEEKRGQPSIADPRIGIEKREKRPDAALKSQLTTSAVNEIIALATARATIFANVSSILPGILPCQAQRLIAPP